MIIAKTCFYLCPNFFLSNDANFFVKYNSLTVLYIFYTNNNEALGFAINIRLKTGNLSQNCYDKFSHFNLLKIYRCHFCLELG